MIYSVIINYTIPHQLILISNKTIRYVFNKYSIGQESGDLSFKKGDKFAVRSQRRDGWWEADNLENGESGMIPSNFMKVINSGRFVLHNYI